MARFPLNPLFTKASREIQQAAARNFQNSDIGRLMREVKSAYSNPGSVSKIAGIIKKYHRISPRTMLEQIAKGSGGSLADVVRTVERYGKGGPGRSAIAAFLKALGPAGNILKALSFGAKSDLGARESLLAITQAIRAFGGEAWLPRGQGTVTDLNRAIEASIQRLGELGYNVTKVGEENVKNGRVATRTEESIQPTGNRKTVDVPLSGAVKRFGPNHPIVTGDMVPTPGSTNVYEFGYDLEHGFLYVRFKDHSGHRKKGETPPQSPGSLYRYHGVTPEEFLSLYKLRNHAGEGGGPGDWVWDHLRQRGTVSGRQKDYELVGVMNGYVPRMATVAQVKDVNGKLEIVEKGGELAEVFRPRQAFLHTGRWVRSQLDLEKAPTSGFMVGERRGGGGGQRTGRYSPKG